MNNITGHWERDGEEFHDLYEMYDWIDKNENWFDEIHFERWLCEHYNAAQIVFSSDDEEVKSEGVWMYYFYEFKEAQWYPDVQDEPVEGRDYYYGPNGDFEFEWIEDTEE